MLSATVAGVGFTAESANQLTLRHRDDSVTVTSNGESERHDRQHIATECPEERRSFTADFGEKFRGKKQEVERPNEDR